MQHTSLLQQYLDLVGRFFIPLAVVFGILLLAFLGSLLKLKVFRTLMLSVPLAVLAIVLTPYVVMKYHPQEKLPELADLSKKVPTGTVDRLITAAKNAVSQTPNGAVGGDVPGTWRFEASDGATLTLSLKEDGKFEETIRPKSGAPKMEKGKWRVVDDKLEFDSLLLRDFNRWRTEGTTFKLMGKPNTPAFGIIGGIDQDSTKWQPLSRVVF